MRYVCVTGYCSVVVYNVKEGTIKLCPLCGVEGQSLQGYETFTVKAVKEEDK